MKSIKVAVLVAGLSLIAANMNAQTITSPPKPPSRNAV